MSWIVRAREEFADFARDLTEAVDRAEREDREAREAAELVAPDPVCTCADYDEHPVCSIHFWVEPAPSTPEASR